jgi:hypothetical protein
MRLSFRPVVCRFQCPGCGPDAAKWLAADDDEQGVAAADEPVVALDVHGLSLEGDSGAVIGFVVVDWFMVLRS